MSHQVYQLLLELTTAQYYDSEYDGRVYSYCTHCHNSQEKDHAHDCITIRAKKLIDEQFQQYELERKQQQEDVALQQKLAEQRRTDKLIEKGILIPCTACGKHFRSHDMSSHLNGKRCIRVQQRNAIAC